MFAKIFIFLDQFIRKIVNYFSANAKTKSCVSTPRNDQSTARKFPFSLCQSLINMVGTNIYPSNMKRNG